MTIEIPDLPPSVNHCYQRAKNKRLFLSKEGKAFMQFANLYIIQTVKKHRWKPIPAGEFFNLAIAFEMKNRVFPDPNNMLKLLIDAMEGPVYENDKWALPMIVMATITGRKHTIVKIMPRRK